MKKYFWVEGLLIKQCFVQILKSVNRCLGGEYDARQMGREGGGGGGSLDRFVPLADFSRALFVAGLSL